MSNSQEEENFRILKDKQEEKKEKDEIRRLLNTHSNFPKAHYTSFGSMNCSTSSARCDCGKEFKSYAFMKMHMERNGCKSSFTSIANGPAISKCDRCNRCNRSFMSKSCLDQHEENCDPFRIPRLVQMPNITISRKKTPRSL